jgi:coenzyme PQQ biosynthesis protein PqqD
MKLERKPIQKTGYQLETIDDELLLYHPAETKVMYCNRTASLIWELCDGQRTVQEIIDLLSEAYPAAESVADDVQETVQQFLDHGAIKLA